MEEVAIEPHHMKPVVGVSFVQLLEDLHLLQTSLVPVRTKSGSFTHAHCVGCCVHHLVVSDDLDGNVVVSLQPVPGPHHVAEHAMSRVAKHSVAAIQLLADTHTCQGRRRQQVS